MKHSESLKEISPAMAKMQSVLQNAPKDSANPFFKSKYADLATCMDTLRPALAGASLSIIQGFNTEGANVSVETMILHSSGEWISTEITATAKDASPQSIGSTITYLRRYGLGITGLVTDEDDDGNHASGADDKSKPPAPVKPKQVKQDDIITATITSELPVKKGVTNNKSWTVYSFDATFTDGEIVHLATFSDTIAEECRAAMNCKAIAEIKYEFTARGGKNIISINPKASN